jgi:hypothetical protein
MGPATRQGRIKLKLKMYIQALTTVQMALELNPVVPTGIPALSAPELAVSF